MNDPFHFKQFTIEQDRCAMKIGTDGVLLGAWTSLEHNPQAVLDIGTGTGIIALMIAQRSGASLIDAVEIDENAYEQAIENFENSDWGDRLFCYHAAFDEFVEEMKEEEAYDLIVSNPPFYQPPLPGRQVDSPEGGNLTSHQRKVARFHDALPFEELLEGVSLLLSKEGRFNAILPRKEEEHFLNLAEEVGLHPQRITRIKGNFKAPEKRSLMEFAFNQKDFAPDVLVLENSRHDYTPEYLELVSDFYLKM